MAAVRIMVLYDDESLDVWNTDGSRLQLSPCGSEYLLEKARPPSPPQRRSRVRHRTRFSISQYRASLVEALTFRNKYATQPYLPEELIPEDQKEKPSPEVSEVQWPPADACRLTCDPGGGVTVCSVDGHARLVLSSCGQEFTVEFTCRCSWNEERSQEPQGQQDRGSQPENPQPAAVGFSQSSEPQQRQRYGSAVAKLAGRHTHTRVVQHHSRLHHPHTWNHPLSLALSQWEARRAHPPAADGLKGEAGKEGDLGHAHMPASQLPVPVPLTCPCPHQHRWRYGSGASDWSDPKASVELVRVVWCQGIVYRVIGGAVPLVEISPADGSVIRSNGVLAEYFTHYRPPSSATVETVYYLNGLPPDLPGQLYSIRNVVTRASRILQCYKQASSSRTPIMPQICWRRVELECEARVISDVQVAGAGQFQALSDGTAHITFLDGVQVQMLWNRHTPAQEISMIQSCPAGAEPFSVWAELCQLTVPDGQQHLLQVDGGGVYHRYVVLAGQWCSWVRQNFLSPNGDTADLPEPVKPHTDQPIDSRSVLAELQKIRRFNFLLDNSPVLKSPTHPSQSSGLSADLSDLTITDSSISEALQRTTKTIQDINTLLAQNQSCDLRSSSHE